MGDAAAAQQVLIVGAGPAGLFAAAELARHGIAARLVERTAAPHAETRATAIQPAVMAPSAQPERMTNRAMIRFDMSAASNFPRVM